MRQWLGCQSLLAFLSEFLDILIFHFIVSLAIDETLFMTLITIRSMDHVGFAIHLLIVGNAWLRAHNDAVDKAGSCSLSYGWKLLVNDRVTVRYGVIE